MALGKPLLFAFSLALLSYCQPEAFEKRNSSDLLYTCNKIAAAISGTSQVFFPPSSDYLSDISHAASSSTQTSACSVEPGCAEDLSEILRILGSTRTPFAVKGSGHATNPGFSSTPGVQIALSRFNQTNVNLECGTVDVGAGLSWDEVYAILESFGLNLVGGRIPGVGVSGLTLGGGFSFLTSQYGLTVDNVVGFELVLPNGTITNVTSKDEDLWFGLRGGLNNFGIVTKFTFKSYPQGEIWGGFYSYAEDQLDAIKEALFNYQQKSDPKAATGLTLTYSTGQFSAVVSFFYDAPTPSGIFDELLAIPNIGGNVSQHKFLDYVESLAPLIAFDGRRVFYDDAPITQYSPAISEVFVDQIKFWGRYLYALDNNITVTTTLEPFDKGLFSHGSDSAYPPDRSYAVFPSVLTVEWANSSLDDTMADALRNMSSTIRAAALAEGQNVSHAAKYVNYALFSTPLVDMYGKNVERLREIRRAIDPDDVMGLSGGFKF